MKKLGRVTILTLLIIILSTLLFVACDKDGAKEKQVPVYKGMTISRSFAKASAMSASDDNGNHYGHFKGDHNDRDDEVDQNKPFEDPNAPSIEDKANSALDVVGAAESIYYADKNQDIFITIRLSNPDSYEILSFTLNGKKYSNYMFEDGSDMENLVLKVNVGDVGGIVEYTIDAIKYVDGTDIKDVRMDGDRTVKAGVRADDQTYVNVTNEQKTMTSITFDAQVVDLYSLIEKSGGYAKAVLYDGVNMLTKDINVGEKTNVVFDNLTPNTVYQYGVVALYDNLSGNGAKLNTLYKKAVYTDTIVLFKDVQVGKECIEWGFVWNESFANKQMSAISLWQNGAKVQDVDTTATRLDGLKSNNEYTLKATYKNLQNQDETISIEFVTYAKAVPTVEIANVQSTQTQVSFELNVTDTDNVGAISKIELLHGEDEPIIAENTARSFENLLSNNDYTIQVTYVYDLNDGVGEQQIVKTADIKTKAKAVPTVEILNAQSTQTQVSFELNITDTDNVGAISKIELLHGDDTPIAVENTDRTFANLLSNNDYTIKVTYTYDLNDGVGERQIVKTTSITTKAKAVPAVEIANVQSTQTQVSFELNVTDTDNVGAISKIELLHGEDEPIVAENTARSFENLLSNNEYTIQVTYVYDLNDGVGEQQIVKTADIKTKAKAVPAVEIANVQSTQTAISFELNVTGTDNVGAITKIELLHGDDDPIVSENAACSFENLLSNNDYTIQVTYVYDLNDGVGEQQIVKTANIKTKAKAAPSVEIGNWTNTQNKLSADVTYMDVDVVGRIENVVLFKGETQVATTNERTHVVFDALEGDTEYTLVVTYKYNLNDGKGEQTATQSAKRYTSPVFEFVEATCANTSAVSKGDVIYFEAIINNPSGVTVEQVKINDRYYAPSAGTTRNSVIVNINVEDQFEGGNTDLVVTEIKGILHGQKVSFSIKNDNNVSVFVNGDFTVNGIKVVDENNDEPVDAVFMDKEYYYLVQIGNKTGYNIDSITISGVVFYAKDIEVIDNSLLKIRIETKYGKNKYGNITAVEYHNDYVGNKSKNIQSAQNFVYECFSNSIPIEINNIEELLAMVQHGYYVLGSDIVFSGTEWMPTTSFDGYLDGQNHSIKGLNCAKTFEDVDIEWGLFKKVSGIVKNLKLYGRAIITITSTDNLIRNALIGGLSARVGDVSIIDIENHISIALSGYGNIGGIIGNDINSPYPDVKMTNCVNYGSISGDVAGGIVGAGFGFVITGCINYGDITGGTIGGISGNGGVIVNCVNDAVVRGRGYVGGIVGAMGTVTQCINKGDIYGETYVGGIGGYQIDISNSINRGTVTSENIAGGILAFGESVSISNVINEGTIIGGAVAGGLIGKAYCHDHGFINTINDSYNSGEIRCSTGLEYGPVVGVLIGTLNNEQCFYISAVEGNEIGEQKAMEEIIEIMKTKWDQNIWDFDNLDENGNPTLK